MIREETIRKALAAIKNPVSQDYFFQKLSSPNWIEPLRKAGVFAKPEPPVRRADGDYYSRWTGSEYLARMAPQAPELVTETFANMDVGDHPWVHRDVITAALSTPASCSARLAELEMEWLARQEHVGFLLAPKYGKLAAKLAAEKETKAALGLIRVLLEVLPDVEDSGRAIKRPRGRIDEHEYEHALGGVLLQIAETIPEQLFELLCDLLEKAVAELRYVGDSAPPHDFSELWRPAVEDYFQNHPWGLTDVLTAALRDVSVKFAASGEEKRAWVVESLERRPWHIFHRIAMHVICEGGASLLDLARARILNRSNFETTAYRHEYARLLRTFFHELGDDDQGRVLGWIDEGPPDLAEWVKRQQGETGEAPSEELCRDRASYWKYERVHPFHEALPDGWKSRYSEWARQFGEPKLAEFTAYHEVRFGDSSPKTAKELGQMEIAQLVEFLKNWRPSGHWDEPSIRGLASELQRGVATEAVQFSSNAAALIQLPPEYMSSVFDGLRDAMRSGTSLSWKPILRLCEWVAQQPRDLPGRDASRYHPDEPHPGWKWVRATIADLLEHGLQQAEDGIPFELRDRVWAILKIIAEDPDPSSGDEAEREESYDPFTASLNTTRGKALHAVMRYVTWVARNVPRPCDKELRLTRGMEEIAEARDLLEQHLDLTREPSLAIRSVFGHYFPLLAVIDPDWASSQRSRVFPPAESEIHLWTAAWNAYVRFNRVYNNVYEMLSGEYERAIERSDEYPVEDRDLADTREGLAEHAMILLGRGSVDLRPNGLIDRFFSTVPIGLQAHAIEFVGRSLSQEQTPPNKAIACFKELWRWLVKAAESTPRASNERLRLASFGSWFTSGQFDAPWSISALEDALRLADRVDNAYFVISVLAEFASDLPNEVLRCLQKVIRSDKEGWGVSGKQEDIRGILRVGLSHADEGVRASATRIVNDLGARGFFSFRDLLGNREADASASSNPTPPS